MAPLYTLDPSIGRQIFSLRWFRMCHLCIVACVQGVRGSMSVPRFRVRVVLTTATWREQVARVADFGKNDTTLTTLTHLGNVLHPGDRVLGYDLLHANLVDDAVDLWLERPNAQLPDVVLVRSLGLNPRSWTYI